MQIFTSSVIIDNETSVPVLRIKRLSTSRRAIFGHLIIYLHFNCLFLLLHALSLIFVMKMSFMSVYLTKSFVLFCYERKISSNFTMRVKL